jgi:protein-tyrosine phosphatase
MMLIVAWTLLALAVMLVAALLAVRRRKPRRLRGDSSAKAYSARHYGKPFGQAPNEQRPAP